MLGKRRHQPEPGSDPVAAHQQHIDSERKRIEELDQQVDRDGRDVETLEQRAAQRLLDGQDAESVALVDAADALARKRKVKQRALASMRKSHAELVADMPRIHARHKQTVAAQCRRQAAELIEQCAPLLAKLAEICDVSYGPEVLCSQPIGTNHYLVSPLPPEARSPLEWLFDPSAAQRYEEPHHRVLIREAIRLEREARDLLVGLPEQPDDAPAMAALAVEG
jgi:hypothetical protein